jgi:Ca2+-binding RTX toxin-like protein
MTVVSDYTSIISGASINGKTGTAAFVSYSFPNAAPDYLSSLYSEGGLATYRIFTEAEKAVARAALDLWGKVSGLTFVEVAPGEGDIKFMAFDLTALDSDAAGFAYFPMSGYDGFEAASDIFIDYAYAGDMHVLLHEIGHALGLKHPFEDDPTLEPSLDNFTQTVMSYTGNWSAGSVLGTFDLEAIRYLYGDQSKDGTQVASWNWDAFSRTLTQTGGTGDDDIFGIGGRDFINGGAGNDRIVGRAGNDDLRGGDGNDNISGGLGDDILDGGLGSDTLTGGAGADSITGGDGTDTIDAGQGANIIDGGEGGDWITAGDGLDRINGGGGNDYIDAGGGDDRIIAGDGDDIVRGGTGNAQIYGNAGDDSLTGGEGDDVIYGGDGDDGIGGGVGRNLLYGGAGTDSLNLFGGVGEAFGEAGNDSLMGAAGTLLDGGDGNDQLTTSGGQSRLYGRGGDDQLVTGTIWSFEDTVLDGGEGNDSLSFGVDVGQGTFRISQAPIVGIENLSILVYAGGTVIIDTSFVSVTLNGGAGDNLLDIGNNSGSIQGREGNDVLVGGSGTAFLSGGEGNDILRLGAGGGNVDGGVGNDMIYAGASQDTMSGGDGADMFVFSGVQNGVDYNSMDIIYDFQTGIDKIDIRGTSPTDIVINTYGSVGSQYSYMNITTTTGSYILYAGGVVVMSDLLAFETTITGSAGNDQLRGNPVANQMFGLAGDDAIYGLGGNDVIDGGDGNDMIDGGEGADRMTGGAGNDLYTVDNTGDVVIEAANGGTDTIGSVYSWTLGANIENLLLLGSGNLSGTGNSLANLLTGNSGNNLLDGKGGADRMEGGFGDDIYVIDNVGDVAFEHPGAGTDTIRTVYSWTLGDHIENLELQGSGNLNGTGNSLANVLTGTSGNNILDGKGGADRMVGGLGNDTYVIDNVGDVVVEAAGTGTDTVRTVYSWTLADNVENLVLLGTGNLGGTGNSLSNVLTGTSGNNTLDGRGGADRMEGGLGNDTYVVDNVGDVVVENASAGTDTIRTVFSWTLGANVENLVLSGSGNLNATGNSLTNVLTGNSGNNVLDGKGGADSMAGGLGNDTYVIDNVGDVVVEAAGAGTDTIRTVFSWTLGDNLENLTLLGTGNLRGTGNALDNVITGNTGANSISGGDGADKLYGGLGADVLSGGTGQDRFYFDSTLGGGNVDRVTDLVVGEDRLFLDDAVFGAVGRLGTLSADALFIGTAAADAGDRFVYNSATGALFYDADGNGVGAAVQFATLSAGLALTATQFVLY